MPACGQTRFRKRVISNGKLARRFPEDVKTAFLADVASSLCVTGGNLYIWNKRASLDPAC